MRFRIFDRYNQSQIISEFSDLTDLSLRERGYTPIYHTLLERIFISALLIFGLAFVYHFKASMNQRKIACFLIVLFFGALIRVYWVHQIKNGVLVGEYLLGKSFLKYEMSYLPLTSKCTLKEISKTGESRDLNFNYNQFLDINGDILQNQFKDLILNFNSRSPISTSESENEQ